MKFTALAAAASAAALTLVPLSASAVTESAGVLTFVSSDVVATLNVFNIDDDGATNAVGAGNTIAPGDFYFGILGATGDTGAGSITFQFTSNPPPNVRAVNFSSDAPNDLFNDATLMWCTTSDCSAGSVLKTAAFVDGDPIATTFTLANPVQYLMMTWSSIDVPGAAATMNFTISASAVPLPAGAALIGTAFLGAGLFTRRRKNAAAA